MRFGRFFLCGVLCAGALVGAALPSQARGLTFEDIRNVVGVSQPHISPDGSRIVYVRSRINWKADRTDRELVLVDVASGASRVLTHDRLGVGSPLWSPDGTRIAYEASPERGKPAQIYVLRMDGGDSERITNSSTGTGAFAWRPDGKALLYLADDEASNKKAVDKHLDAVVITDQDYLTRTTAVPSHIWTVNADGTKTTRVTSGVWSVTDAQWTADGTKIYYIRQPDAIFAHFVQQTAYVHDLANKTDAPLGIPLAQNPSISNDGSMIALQVPRHGSPYLQNDISVRSLSDMHEVFNSDKLDRNVHSFVWMPGDKQLAVATADGVRNVLWTLSNDGSASKADLGDLDVAPGFTIANNGATAFVGARRDAFDDLYYLAPGSTTPKKLSDENPWIASVELGKTEAFESPTDTGMTAVGVLTYPVGYVAGKKYPLILDIHGGPVSTSAWDLDGLEPPFDQVLAARGYFVFRPNYRGSDNEGDAFLQAIVGDVTSGPGRDNLAAVDALRKTGMIDDSRIGVSGWSGGGLQTSWLIGHATFWRAAVSGAAVNDWYQQAVLADINENFAQTFFGGVLPFSKDGRAKYAAESPLTYYANVKTPTLILSDTQDQRVPVSQAYTFYHALRDRGVPVQFTAFPRYGHFSTDPVGREVTLRAWAAWFDRWMK